MGDPDRTVVEGLAAIATGLAEMSVDDADARTQVRRWIDRLAVDAPTIRAAAEVIARQSQLLEESAEETELARPIREVLGLTSTKDQLAAALRAREWLAAEAE